MSTTQTVTARQDSGLIDDIEKKDVHTPSSNEKLDYVETIDFDSTDDRSEQLRLKEVEELEARLATGIADDKEYLVSDAHDLVIKVLSTRDDYELPVLTFRMLFLGLGFSAFGSVLAQLYYFKPQTLSVSQGFLLIILYFFGKAWEKALPSHGLWWYLNPGPFNIKEHGAALIMASTASSSATAIQVISVQDLYYGNKLNPAVAIFTLLSSQLIGYSFAGLLIEALIYPSVTFWPSSITPANMFQALHFDGGLSSKRTKIFWLVFAAIFCYEIIPQWIFPLLTGVSIFCLVDNSSGTFRNIFGGASNNEGMGLLAVCFDWNLIGSPCLYTPLWTQLNQNIGICLTYILMSAVYYGNIWQGKRFPFMSQAIFDINGNQYNQTAILTNNKFDPAKFEQIGPAYFSSTNALYFITANLAMGATLVHVVLFYHDQLMPFIRAFNPWNKTVSVVHDEHYIVMKRYDKVPKWWFLCLLVIAYSISQATDYTGNSHFTWWQLTVILVISLVFTMAYCTTSAILGFAQFSTQLDGFYSMIASYMVPGDPIANMYAALYGSQPTVQGIMLLGDLKLGQYLKIPPKINFLVQVLGCVVGALLNYVMELSIVANQRAALLTIAGTRLWSGQNAQSFNSNAIAWGALGREMFSPGKTYYMVPVALALGALMPIPQYLLHRRFPRNKFLSNFNTGIVMQYSCFLSVGINTSVNTSSLLGIMSQWWMRTKHPRWFTKYNYIISGALDGGTQVISFILNLAVFGAAGTEVDFPQWWGNDFNLSADRCAAPA
ncbi:OPT oligopeptide transporter [Lentinula edodes]|uniref:OPT oligopeptide transporter n=1 Tax=Lentinula edodes TaxID=5353 RepID=UPI001E8E58C0|nr:OPT oligopeptide transporter [Lentinula edodes]KAH7872644.1 OPT oligopeptide transporter [Lentinula edodes]KAJ3917402.1 OPT oligopeptide transporter protein-domain-containing protein [Lentinula edodes]